ncbi:MAG: hypothetical protein MJ252_27515, partial [archaeon]|nr:hypothetical protein [archaeon]
GIDLNIKNNEGNTPIMDLIKNNIAKENVRLIKLLLESGAKTENIYNKKGDSFYSLLGEEAEMLKFQFKNVKNKNEFQTFNLKNLSVLFIAPILILFLANFFANIVK